jgi:hypothetical protein
MEHRRGSESQPRQPEPEARRAVILDAAWFGTYAETIRQSPHAAELLDAKHRLSADLVTDASRRYQCLVRDVLAEAAATGELDLDAAGLTADTAAELMIASARGLESIAASPAAYRRHLDTLVRVMIAGLTPRGNRS